MLRSVFLRWTAGLVLAVCLVRPSLGSSPEATEPWLAGAFEASADDVALAVSELEPPSADVELLLRDDTFRFDREGKMTHTRRWVYRILTPQGLDGWSVSEAAWSPWHQNRPELRARIVTSAGQEHRLSPASILELDASRADLGGARQLIRGPLRVTVGAIVEEVMVLEDREPYFSAGVSAKHLLVMPVPIRRGRLTLEAPVDLPLRFGVRGAAGLEPRRELVDDQVRLVFEVSDVASAKPVETGLPPTEPRYPHVAFSTAESWAKVAGAYAERVDGQIAGNVGEQVLERLAGRRSGAQVERVEELLRSLRRSVEYRPVELGATAADPTPPLTTLSRGYGDSKDLAAVLVAALRSEGIPAYVALQRAGYGMDLDPGLPGLGRFNHALVYLPASEPVWLDPGDRFSRAGELASDRQGRWTLVASPNTHDLIRTPVADSQDNRSETTIEIFMAKDGPARIVETSVHYGAAERRQRLVSAGIDADERRLGYEAYVKAAYRAEALGAVEETALEDLTAPFRLELEARRAGRAWTSQSEAAVAIDLSYLISSLPRELLVTGAEARQRSFVFHEPSSAQWHYRIHPPPGMRLRTLPPDAVWQLGAGRLARSVRHDAKGVTVEVTLDSGPRELDAGQFRDTHQAVQRLLAEEVLVLWFDARTKKRNASSNR
ncbi:MAG: DUF3857 domain-containing transglutaminase family protein [Acidobacteriota bacterium]